MGSTRLPGKVMRDLCGRPMIQYLAVGLEICGQIVYAIPAKDDETLGALLRKLGCCIVFAWDGDENDVTGRFAACLEARRADRFVRICADSPLLDHRLIEMVGTFYRYPYAKISSPVGCVEMVDTKAWLAKPDKDREHVTTGMGTRTLSLMPWHTPRLVVDTEEDFRRVEAVVRKMTRPHWEYTWQEICALASGEDNGR